MRQAGVIAAAGIVAIETMVERLAEDHERARKLARGLETIQGIVLDPGTPYTNMVYVNLSRDGQHLDADLIAQELAKRGVLVGIVGKSRFRLVTHYWIDDQAVDQTVETFGLVLKQGYIR
jgi:threonine aldolase